MTDDTAVDGVVELVGSDAVIRFYARVSQLD